MAVVGVGGGRDILAAIWSKSPSITGVEINGNVVALLTDYHRRFTRLADHPGVRLVHDEGRAYLTRSTEQLRRGADVTGGHLGGNRRRRVHAQ